MPEEGAVSLVTRAEYLDAGSDRELVARFQEGDEGAFVELVHTHYPSLIAQARRRLRAPSDAEDAVQETLLRAYRALDRFGGDYQLRAWLGRILANVCNDVGHHRLAESMLEERLAGLRQVEPSADDAVPDETVFRAVREALAGLPVTYRRAFVLRDLENRSYSEVASAMAITEVNARARVHRARSALQRSLRSLSGTMGALLLPLPFGERIAQALSGRLVRQGGRFDTLGAGAASPGGVVGAGAGAPLNSLGSMLPGASQLAGLSQVATQAVAAPALQTVVNALPDVARSSVGAIATLAAASLAIVAPSALSSPGPGQSAAAPAGISADPLPGTGQLAPAAQVAAPTETTTTSSPDAATGQSTSTSSSTPAWSWVAGAATATTGTSGDSSQGSSSTDTTGSGADPASTTGTNAGSGTGTASATAAPPVDAPSCPWLLAFPDQAPGGDPLPPPVLTGASSYISTGTVALATTGPVFSAGAPGTLSNSNGTTTVQAMFGACLPGAQTQALMANVSDTGPGGAEWQMRGAYVSTTETGGTTDSYFRGFIAPLGAAPATGVPFVADLTTVEPANLAMLRIAIFGDVPGLTDTTTSTSGSTGSTTTSQSTSQQAGTTTQASDAPKQTGATQSTTSSVSG